MFNMLHNDVKSVESSLANFCTSPIAISASSVLPLVSPIDFPIASHPPVDTTIINTSSPASIPSCNSSPMCVSSTSSPPSTDAATISTSSSSSPSFDSSLPTRPFVPIVPTFSIFSKSFCSSSSSAAALTSPRAGEASTSKDGGDKDQKQIAIPSHARIGSNQSKMLEETMRGGGISCQNQHHIVDGDVTGEMKVVDMPLVSSLSLVSSFVPTSSILVDSSHHIPPVPSLLAMNTFAAPITSSVIGNTLTRIVPRREQYINSMEVDDGCDIASGAAAILNADNRPSAAAPSASIQQQHQHPSQQQSTFSSAPSSSSAVQQEVEEEKMGEQPKANASSSSRPPSKQQSIAAQLRLLFDAPSRIVHPPSASSSPTVTTSSSSSSSLSSSSHSTPASASSSASSLFAPSACHCLIVDPSRIVAESIDTIKLLSSALEATCSDAERLARTLSLLVGVNASNVGTVYVTGSNPRQLHINFVSYDALAQALLSNTFLVRCGLAGRSQSVWSRGIINRACGPERQHLPELLKLTCVPSREVSPVERDAAVATLLVVMGIQHTSIIINNISSPNYAGNAPARIIVTIVPRCINNIPSLLSSLHKQHSLFGSIVAVSAPNRPDLHRCEQCDLLGHQPSSCPTYGGLGLRLLHKQPVPYADVAKWITASGARIGYLGTSIGAGPPCRVMTLLFDVDANDAEAVAAMMHQVGPLVVSARSLLHSSPSIINTSQRSRECRQCGDCTKEHQCPFATGVPVVLRSSVNQQPIIMSSHRPQPFVVSRVDNSSGRPAFANNNNNHHQICNQWRRSKKCDRMTRGEACPYQHPHDHVIDAASSSSSRPPRVCFDHRDRGSCARGASCNYSHAAAASPASSVAPSLIQPSPPIAPALSAPAPTSASASLSAAATSSSPSPPSLDAMQQQRVSAMSIASVASVSSPSKKRTMLAEANANNQRVTTSRHQQSVSPKARPSKRGRGAASAVVEDAPSSSSSSNALPRSINMYSTLNNDEDDIDYPSSSSSSIPISSLSTMSSPSRILNRPSSSSSSSSSSSLVYAARSVGIIRTSSNTNRDSASASTTSGQERPSAAPPTRSASTSSAASSSSASSSMHL